MFSEEIKNLLLPSDYFLALLYIALFGFSLYQTTPARLKAERRIVLLSVLLKSVAVVINCLLIKNYWKTGDSLSYFSEAQTFANLVKQDFSSIKYLFLPLDSYISRIGTENTLASTISGVSNESNFMVSRFTTLFYFLGFGRFLLVNLLFSFLALAGQLRIIGLFCKYFPRINKTYLTIGVILSPSLLFYASPLYKETLCIGFIGLLLFFTERLIMAKDGKLKYLAGLLFSSFVIAVTKNYLFYILIIAALTSGFILFIIWFFKRRLTNKIILGVILFFATLFAVNNIERLDGFIVPVVEHLNHFEDLYIDPDNEGSTFKLGEIDLSFVGLCSRLPLAIYTSMFRPHLWEITKPILILNSLESVILFLLVLYVLIFRTSSFLHNIQQGIPLFLFIYSIVVFAVVGLTTFNFGTMVRYKNPGLIFFNIFLVLCLMRSDSRKAKSQPPKDPG